jgi:hypothetical protein
MAHIAAIMNQERMKVLRERVILASRVTLPVAEALACGRTTKNGSVSVKARPTGTALPPLVALNPASVR